MNKSNQKQRKVSLLQRIAIILCGLLLVALTLETGLRASGFIMLSMQEHKNLQSIKEKGSCRIMCLGESTTQNQYPPHLEEILNKRNIGIKFSVIDKGLASIDTGVVMAQLEANLDKYQPDMVVTMMGCNDRRTMYYQDIPESDTWLFRHCRVYRFSRLIYTRILKKLKKEDIYRVKSPDPNQSKYSNIEESSRKTIGLNPKDDSAYLALGQLYRNQGRYVESEQALKKAIRLNPKNEFAYTELGQFYKNQERYAEAEQILNKAIESNPKYELAYVELGRLYKDQKRHIESEQILNKAIKLNLKSDQIYIMLGQVYKEQKRYAESELMLKKAIELNPHNELACGGLATVYGEMGKNGLSMEYAEKANSLRGGHYDPTTINNYHKLKQILDKRKIKLVCAQYPMRSVQPLKKIFKDDENIIFVDNERIFKDAVRKEGYNEYFRDMFGGDFGHCTQKGNRLLAQNIANAILKDINIVYLLRLKGGDPVDNFTLAVNNLRRQ